MKNLKNIFFKITLILFLFLIFIFVCAKSYSNTMSNNLSNSFLRLHVIANSDSTEDQIFKYQIRDAILEYIEPQFQNINTKEEAISLLNDNLNNLSQLIQQIINDNGLNYSFNIAIGNFYFPTKEYSNFILPNGYYDALQIKLGKGSGQNWWCVMFPSVCIIDSSSNFCNSSDKYLEQTLSSEEYKVISTSESTPQLTIKFKLIEFFENL